MKPALSVLISLAAAAALATGGWYLSRIGGPDVAGGARASPVPEPLRHVAALGRIEPRHGVIRLSGPPRPAVVIEELHVDEGDVVEEGQVVAVVQGVGLQSAEVRRFGAELESARRELRRMTELRESGQLSESAFEEADLRVEMAAADLARAEADLELSTVRSPIAGVVLDVHVREGERAGASTPRSRMTSS